MDLINDSKLQNGKSENKEFVKLRNNVVLDCMTYIKLIVPFVKKTLNKIIEVFNFFDEKGYQNAEEFLSDINQFLSDVKDILKMLKIISSIHVEVAGVAG